jgi:hypothetical protein
MIYSKKVVALVFLLPLVLLGVFCRHQISKSPYNDIVLAENRFISSQWEDVDVTELVKIKGDGQFLSVIIDEPLDGDFFKQGIKTPNGEIFNFEVKLLDKDGTEYLLPFDGFLGQMRINYRFYGELPRNKTYDKVLIRSNVPIKAKRILWTYYNVSDLK